MSRLTIVYLILLINILLMAEACNRGPAGNEDIFTELEGDEGVYMIKIPVVLFNGIAASELSDGESIDEIGDIELVKILMFDQKNAKNITTADIKRIILNKFEKMGYEELINISSGGMSSSAYVLEKADYISDLMVVVTENESVIGIGLSGKLDFGAISRFASNFDYGKLKGYLNTD